MARRLQRTARVRSAIGVVIAGVVAPACSFHPAATGEDDDHRDASMVDTPPPPGCVTVDPTTPVEVAIAGTADDYALTITAQSSATSWGTTGNEAVVLDVIGETRGFIGHLVLHQGSTTFDYGMAIGALAASERVTVKVSSLSAPNAVLSACVVGKLVSATELGDAGEGLVHAPIYRWPIQKSFDDLPMVTGWSKARRGYQSVFTNEDGGTVAQCGGGAGGIQAEIGRWGRAADIEGDYSYDGTPSWGRCTNTTTTALRLEGQHPIVYMGDGHNRLFESRAGYGQTCGTGTPEKPNGDLDGWNVNNPDNSLAGDDGRVIVIRPLPVDLDALDYAAYPGRRDGLIDTYAPWLYRITALELQRENKIDDDKSLAMSRYLYADVRVSDVDGTGDSYCSPFVTSGFRLRVVTTTGQQIDGPQITKDYAGASHDWKRIAIKLPAGVGVAEVDHLVFDAYDADGIYLTGLGDMFIAQPVGDNGATLYYVRHGVTPLAYYVDDDSSGCVGGVQDGGPGGSGTAYACAGSQVTLTK